MEKGQLSMMVVVTAIIALLIGAVIGWFTGSKQSTPLTQIQNATLYNKTQLDLNKETRTLWEDHITWTRMFLISTAYNNEDTNAVTQRLLKNQADIGNSIKPFYGDEAGNKLEQLLKTHITISAELVTAAKKGDQTAQNTANDKWYANANEIADFLSSANPNWPKDQTRAMMKEHLDLTKQEAVNILENKFDENITDYDKIHDQILKMADMLTDGIIKQFPDKF